MSAVSNVVTPSSSAALTQEIAASFSTCEPWVIQLPYEISLTTRPLRPRCRWFMVPFNPEIEHDANCVEHIEYGRGSRPTSDPLFFNTRADGACRYLLRFKSSSIAFMPRSISQWQLAKEKRDVP